MRTWCAQPWKRSQHNGRRHPDVDIEMEKLSRGERVQLRLYAGVGLPGRHVVDRDWFAWWCHGSLLGLEFELTLVTEIRHMASGRTGKRAGCVESASGC